MFSERIVLQRITRYMRSAFFEQILCNPCHRSLTLECRRQLAFPRGTTSNLFMQHGHRWQHCKENLRASQRWSPSFYNLMACKKFTEVEFGVCGRQLPDTAGHGGPQISVPCKPGYRIDDAWQVQHIVFLKARILETD
ncbi:uncharacterized protein LOC143159783 isoform X2 [Aptenodytes patagonicus]|uniref:uncharacterized protein LOC143159783 isoform X2 n=1 Tax=Aptenodytes patagonicus TaxID=9234 RepID=UPI003F9FC52D